MLDIIVHKDHLFVCFLGKKMIMRCPFIFLGDFLVSDNLVPLCLAFWSFFIFIFILF